MSSRSSPGTSGGSVLILALWVVFFLAALTLATGSHVSALLSAASRLSARVHAQAQAAAGAAYAAAIIQSQTNTWDGLPGSAWNRDDKLFHDVDMDGIRFSLMFSYYGPDGVESVNGVLGEESKINLNRAPRGLLSALFMTAGSLSLSDADALAVAVAHWRGDDDEQLTEEGGRGYYSQTALESLRSPRLFESPDELLLVDGMDERLYGRLLPYVTVYGSGLLNINAALPVVLEALGVYAAGDGGKVLAAPVLAGRIVRYREAGNGFKEADYLSIRADLEGFEPLSGDEGPLFTAMAGMLTVRSTAFAGTVFGAVPDAEGRYPMQIDFVWDSEKHRFAMWRER